MEIDNSYHGGLIITDYYREYDEIILKSLINSNINLTISMFYEKQNNYRTIKELTYFIGNTGVNLKDGSENREDVEIAAFSYNDAKYIRKEMQINNQDLYYLCMYINIFAESEKELEHLLNKIEGILQSNGITSKRANFREEQAFKACLPIMENEIEIKNASKRNILTNGLISTYSFISSTICDENGVLFGTNIYSDSLIFVDRFNINKYKNSNMSIFGTSGAGKSFFAKLLILRSRLIGINQYVIDPEREYGKLCKNLDGALIKIGPSSKSYINVLDIRENSSEEEKRIFANKTF